MGTLPCFAHLLTISLRPLDLLCRASQVLCFPFNDPARSYDESVPL